MNHSPLRHGCAVALGCLGALLRCAASAQAQTSNRSNAAPALLNVLNQPLQACSHAPLTGNLRNGSCVVSAQDAGVHGVCAVMNARFLAYTKAQGNDLSTPNPKLRFPGLKPGQRWCVCAGRWQQALDAGVAPKVVQARDQQGRAEFIVFGRSGQARSRCSGPPAASANALVTAQSS